MNKILLSLFLVISLISTAWANNGWYSTLQGTASDVEQTPPPNGVTIAYNTTDHQWEFNYGLAPAGGTTGTCLEKNSNSDYDYSWVTCSGGGSGLTVGTTTIANGTNGYVEYNNNGVLGEKAGGSGTVTSITFSSPLTGGTITGSGTVGITANTFDAYGAASAITLAGLGGTTLAAAEAAITPTELGLVIGTNVLAQRTFGTAANNNTGDFLASGGTAANSSELNGQVASYYAPLASPMFTGNVGIGTTNPGSKIDVNGTATFGASDQGRLTIGNGAYNGNVQLTSSGANGYLYFNSTGGFTVFQSPTNIIPNFQLEAAGTSAYTGIFRSYSDDNSVANRPLLFYTSGQSAAGDIMFYSGVNDVGATPNLTSRMGNYNIIFSPSGTGSTQFVTGNVGIGSTTANFKLQVAGTADVQGFSLNQNPGSGYVLVGTNVGVGTWMAASTLPISGGSWVNTATSALNMSGYGISNINNVGVGTITANNTLTVNNAQILGSGSANIGIGTISTGALTLNSFSTGCLTNTSGVVSSTGTACGGSAWNGTATSLLNMGGYGITNAANIGVGTITANNTLTVNNAQILGSGSANIGIGTGLFNTITVAGTANHSGQILGSGNANIGIGTGNFNNVCIAGSCNTSWPASTWVGTATSDLSMAGHGITNVNNVGVGTLTASAGLTVVGNVGIGTASPTHTLDVNGTINASGAITGGITSGSSLLSGNGSGGFSNVTVGTGLQFTGGTLSNTNGFTTQNVVTGSRTIGSYYHNTTGKSMLVSIEYVAPVGGGMSLVTDSNPTPTTQVGGGNSTFYTTASMVVLPNNYYGITQSGGSGGIAFWTEWY